MDQVPPNDVLPNAAQPNCAALEVPVSRAEVREFRTSTRAAQRRDPGVSTAFTTTTSVISVVVVIGFLAFFALIFSLTVGSGGSISFDLFFLVIFGIVAFLALRSVLGLGGSWRKWLRLTRFAAANGLLYRTKSADPSYPGCVFNHGSSRMATDHFSTLSGRFMDFGNYQYTTGSGKNRTTHTWGFLAMQLDRNLPNIVLDSKANNGLFGTTNLPATFSRDQVLSLEGDFDRYFTLYCPKEYEQDALYVLTPDLMALLIDDASPFDVEIVDNWLFVYSAKSFNMLSPAVYRRIFSIVETIGSKTISQTARYHDDRVLTAAANIVAPQGQRLRHGVSVSSIVVIAVFASIWLWSTFHGG